MNAVRALETLRSMGRPVVRTGEAAAVLGVSTSSASHLLASLQAAGSILRVVPGRWAMTPHPDPNVVAGWITEPYPSCLSLYTALSAHGLITQIPRTVYVVSTADTRTMTTAVGTFSIHRLSPNLFGGYEDHAGVRMATPEKALFDTLYLGRARGKRFRHLTEIEFPPDFRFDLCVAWIEKIQDPAVRGFVRERLAELSPPRG